MFFIILFDLINKINILLYLIRFETSTQPWTHQWSLYRGQERPFSCRQFIQPAFFLHLDELPPAGQRKKCVSALASLFGCSRHLHRWNCTYFPVSMLERDGQHMGVVTKALEKEVPPSSIMRRVLFIACIDPTWRNRRLAHCKACPPALVISSLVSVGNCSKSFAS